MAGVMARGIAETMGWPASLLQRLLPDRPAMPRGGSGRQLAGPALALVACCIVAGCTRHDSSADDTRPGGFYGGVSGGMTSP
jgi:hypothetical protein